MQRRQGWTYWRLALGKLGYGNGGRPINLFGCVRDGDVFVDSVCVFRYEDADSELRGTVREFFPLFVVLCFHGTGKR